MVDPRSICLDHMVVSDCLESPDRLRICLNQLNEDLHAVLMDNTEGHAWQRVKAVESISQDVDVYFRKHPEIGEEEQKVVREAYIDASMKLYKKAAFR